MRRSSREVSDSIQKQSGGFQLSDREQTTENICRKSSSKESSNIKIPVQRVQKNIEIPPFAQEARRSKIMRTTLGNTFEEQDTLNQARRAWNIECVQYEIQGIISPASTKAMQAEAERRKREEILQE